MKRFFVSLFLLALIVLNTNCCQPCDYVFYIKVDSGVSGSESAHVCAPNPPWNPAVQGYNANLGISPIAGLSIGCELFDALDIDVTLANRSTFKYRKFQTPTTGGGSYTRELSTRQKLFVG
jgi:hypothetical protein